MMIKLLVRGASRLVGCAALVLAVSAPVQGVQVTLPPLALPVQIIGADSACPGGFTAGGTPTAPTLTCVTGSGTPVPSCTLGANPTALSGSSGATQLTATCTNNPTSYTWTATPAPSSGFSTNAASTQAPTITANTTFSVQASNGSGAGNMASVAVTVNSGGGGLGGFASCTGYTVINGGTLPFVGSPQGGSSGSGFGDNVAWVFQLTVPAGQAATGTNGSFTLVENGGNEIYRHVVISQTPCDFNRNVDYTGATGPIGACRNGATCGVNFQVGAPTFFGVPRMQSGQTYFISVRDWSDFIGSTGTGGPSCGGGSCPAVFNYTPTQ